MVPEEDTRQSHRGEGFPAGPRKRRGREWGDSAEHVQEAQR